MRFYFIALLSVVLLLPSMVIGAINIDGFTSATNDRFDDDAQFVAGNYDLSGVALNESGRWLTMISEKVFITARHFSPASGSSVTFYAANDPSGYSSTRIVTSDFQQIGTSDLYLGTLNSPLDSSFTFYEFATADITSQSSFNSSGYNGADAFLFGRSPTNFTASQDIAVGLNKLDRFYAGVSVSPSTGDAIVSTVNQPADGNYLSYESALQSGDSGAPLMVISGLGELTIVGINWFIATLGGDDLNGHTYVGSYDAAIQSFIDANPVPESSTYVLFTGLLAIIVISVKRLIAC